MEKSNNKKKRLFPKLGTDISLLKIDKVGEYSISIPEDAKDISNIVSKTIKKIKKSGDLKKMIITDATAGVGGNTISFSNIFGKINAIEIDRTRYEYLVNNLTIYGKDNVNFFNNDFLEIINELVQDVIFIDPPWGGKNYKFKSKIKLKISDVPLEKICNDLIGNGNAELVVLKLPTNYDMEYLKESINGSIKVYSVRKMNIVCITKDNYSIAESL